MPLQDTESPVLAEPAGVAVFYEMIIGVVGVDGVDWVAVFYEMIIGAAVFVQLNYLTVLMISK